MGLSIVFDLENTLVGCFKNQKGQIETEARPGALKLLNQLRELKKTKRDITYILFTKSTYEATVSGIEALYAEDFFDEIITIENFPKFDKGSVEELVFGKEGPFYGLKPVSMVDGDYLLVEDNYQMIQAIKHMNKEYEKRGEERELERYTYLVSYYESTPPYMLEFVYELEKNLIKSEDEIYLIKKTKEYINRNNEISLMEMKSLYNYIYSLVINR